MTADEMRNKEWSLSQLDRIRASLKALQMNTYNKQLASLSADYLREITTWARNVHSYATWPDEWYEDLKAELEKSK